MNNTKDTVSFSEMAAWKTCRKKWYYIYDLNIAPKKRKRLVSFGSCGHFGLRALHKGNSYEDAVNVWIEKEIEKGDWFDEEIEDMRKLGEDVKCILNRYTREFQNAKWTPVLIEEKFEIPIPGIKRKLLGYMDLVIKDEEGKLWIVENKFPAKSFRTIEEIEMNTQLGTYHYSALRLGLDVVGLIYEQILQKVPSIPAVNKNGSISRSDIMTDWETYKKVVVEQGLNSDDYLDMEMRLKEKKFFQRDHIYRSKKEVAIFMDDTKKCVWDLIKTKKHIYRNVSFLSCPMCPYRELCSAEARGHDYQYILENDFKKREKREDYSNDTDASTEPDLAE